MEAAIFDDLTALADATRSRMLLVLERHELTVTELCAVLQLPQSTVSRHLKTLLDAEWVSSRRDGTSGYYTLALDDEIAVAGRVLALSDRLTTQDLVEIAMAKGQSHLLAISRRSRASTTQS